MKKGGEEGREEINLVSCSQRARQGWNMTFMWTGIGHNSNNGSRKRGLFAK